MTSRERLLTILRGEKRADRIAWSPLIDGYFMSSFPDSKDIVDVFKEIHADVMERHVYTWRGIIEHRGVLSRLNTLNHSGDQIYSENEVTVSRKTQPHKNGTLLTVEYDIPGYRLSSEFMYTEKSP